MSEVEYCENGCNVVLIYYCPQCGAPVCCPKCCDETTEYLKSQSK